MELKQSPAGYVGYSISLAGFLGHWPLTGSNKVLLDFCLTEFVIP